MKTEPNDPMQPCEVHTENGEQYYAQTGQYSHMLTGLTKREYFAGLAMQGINAAFYSDAEVMATTSRYCKGLNVNPVDYFANMAVEQADALIKALNKSES